MRRSSWARALGRSTQRRKINGCACTRDRLLCPSLSPFSYFLLLLLFTCRTSIFSAFSILLRSSFFLLLAPSPSPYCILFLVPFLVLGLDVLIFILIIILISLSFDSLSHYTTISEGKGEEVTQTSSRVCEYHFVPWDKEKIPRLHHVIFPYFIAYRYNINFISHIATT